MQFVHWRNFYSDTCQTLQWTKLIRPFLFMIVLGVQLGHITQGLQVAQFHQSVHAPSSSYSAPGKISISFSLNSKSITCYCLTQIEINEIHGLYSLSFIIRCTSTIVQTSIILDSRWIEWNLLLIVIYRLTICRKSVNYSNFGNKLYVMLINFTFLHSRSVILIWCTIKLIVCILGPDIRCVFSLDLSDL